MASPKTGPRGTDLVYAGIALIAAVLTVVGERFDPVLIVFVVLALVPWIPVVAGVAFPLPIFAALAIIPVVPVVALTGIGSGIFLSLAAASRVASRSDRRALVGLVTGIVVLLPFLPSLLGFEWDKGAVYFSFGALFSMLVGVLLRRSSRLAEELRLADAELAGAAARQERHRIARDVHDLVAHSLTVVVLHVGGARRVLRTDPDAAEKALRDAERVSRESLDAIRGVVGLLREDAESPVLSLDVERLVTTYRSAGLPVALRVDGAFESLPLVVRVTLYRVVQEALANVARHGTPGATVSVDVEIDEKSVVARIENDLGSPSARPAPGGIGYGLVGLEEQAASLGGELSSGPHGDTWVVECRLPLRGAP
jgi:signal transduction histidine kinase